MAIVSPSLLAADVLNLEKDVRAAELAGAKWLHVDVMDGSFVPNLSFGYSTVKALRGITDRVLDVHLMIQRPLRYVEHFCTAGADILTIHVEADTYENTCAALQQIRQAGVRPGIVLKPATDVSALEPYLELVDLVLVMTVEPGFGGQSFMPDMMPKLRQLRQRLDQVNPQCMLQVDGGVDAVTGLLCRENGADVLVAGSAFFKAQDRTHFLRQLEA